MHAKALYLLKIHTFAFFFMCFVFKRFFFTLLLRFNKNETLNASLKLWQDRKGQTTNDCPVSICPFVSRTTLSKACEPRIDTSKGKSIERRFTARSAKFGTRYLNPRLSPDALDYGTRTNFRWP